MDVVVGAVLSYKKTTGASISAVCVRYRYRASMRQVRASQSTLCCSKTRRLSTYKRRLALSVHFSRRPSVRDGLGR